MKSIPTIAAAVTLLSVAAPLIAQTKPAVPSPAPQAATQGADGITPPADYVIGVADVLTINYWKDSEMTTDTVVRPDGKITLPLINDVDVLGLTTAQLRERLLAKSTMLEDPRIDIIVKAINSRKVYIVGSIAKPGEYSLLAPLDVLSLVSMAGGLREFTDGKKIRIVRDEGGKPTSFLFNYQEVLEGKNLKQNILLKPGDRVMVPE